MAMRTLPRSGIPVHHLLLQRSKLFRSLLSQFHSLHSFLDLSTLLIEASPSAAMASAPGALLPSASLRGISGRRATGSCFPLNPWRSRVSMSASAVSSQAALSADDVFGNYAASSAFLFPGQGAQTVGMGSDARNVPSAAQLFSKANDILGVGIDNPTIEVRFEHLNIGAEAYVGNRGLPTFTNFFVNNIRAFLSSIGVIPTGKRPIPILDDVSGIIRPCRRFV